MQQLVQKIAIALLSGSPFLGSPLGVQAHPGPEMLPISQLNSARTGSILLSQAANPTPPAPLSEGKSGPSVEALQKRLKQKGFDPGPIDSVFGTQTKTALIAFQKSQGLRPDGIADAKTLAALGVNLPAPATGTAKLPKATPPATPKPAKAATAKAPNPSTPTPNKPAAPPAKTAAPTPKPLAPRPTSPQPPVGVVVADKYYWPGPEGNLGLKITGKFISLEKEAATFDLLQEIGQFRGRQWKLADILVAVDLNANGNVATWQVSGPRPLITEYLDRLRKQYEDRSLFYDFGFTYVNFKPTIALEAEK